MLDLTLSPFESFSVAARLKLRSCFHLFQLALRLSDSNDSVSGELNPSMSDFNQVFISPKRIDSWLQVTYS